MFKNHALMSRSAVVVVSLVALSLSTTAFAGNGGGTHKTSSSSISLATANSLATSPTSGPHYGDNVTFNVSTTETTSPFVNLRCYQDGALVGEGWANYSTGSPAFGLYSPQWTDGAADCTAWLDMYSNGKWRQLASTSFHVDA